jgi:hypothetical protein
VYKQDASGHRGDIVKKDRGTKSQTLSLRLDPKTKFTLEFVARIRGQTITTVVERAIRESCDQVRIRPVGGLNDYTDQCNWQQFWDPEEGVRTLKLLRSPDYPSTFDEDDLKEFTKAHWQFFYREHDCMNPHRGLVQMLWPKIESYRRIWNEQRASDYFAAGRAMAADLQAAKVAPPQWPPRKPALPKPVSGGRGDMDDEIPF